jgi:hypothetical protein
MVDFANVCRPGMLIFQDLPNSERVALTELASGAPFSHVAIILGRNSQGHCEAIEAVGGKGLVDIVPIAEVLHRRRAKNFLKIAPEQTATHIAQTARRFQGTPYDFTYRNGNRGADGSTPLTCTELVVVAADDAPMRPTLDAVSIPAHWLNFDAPQVVRYIRQLGYSGPGDPALRHHRLTTVVDLYFHDALRTPIGERTWRSTHTVEDARYDTLPGKTLEEKYRKLLTRWKKHLPQIQHERDPDGTRNNHRFFITTKVRTYSLILFGVFPDEAQLAKQLQARLQR